MVTRLRKMVPLVLLAVVWLWSAPALAGCEATDPLPARAVIGHPYIGSDTPSEMRFINVRSRPITVLWVSFDGGERRYAQLGEGEEMIQPTYVAHRWLIRDALDGRPLTAFISTEAAARSPGNPQIALVR
ncbi:von Hippel-Lindau disease tumor suppressor protein [Sphingomonas sp. F9_3S_D5_B_2]